MPRTKHGFCSLHRIAYLRAFDATCPQCLFSGVTAEQLDYDPEAVTVKVATQGGPVDAAGNPVDLEEL
jgi:hypothetical protein